MDENVFVSEFEWAISNTETAYPFLRPAFAPGFPTPFSHLVADAAVSLSGFRGEIRLASISSAEDGSKITLTDGESTLTMPDGAAVDYGGWRMMSWTGVRGTVRLTLLRERIPLFPWPVAPRDAVFVPHAIQAAAASVTGVVVGGRRVDGDVTFRLGYNMAVEYGEAGSAARPGRGLSLTAYAGGGDGPAPCGHECPPAIMTINNISADGKNNFTLEGVDCYSVTPSLMETVGGDYVAMPGFLRVNNGCSPCCDCDDYGSVYTEIMTPFMEKGHVLAAAYHELLAKYTDLVDRIRAAAAARARPEVKLVVTPGLNHSAYVAVGLFNHSPADWPEYPQVVRVDFAATDGTPGRVVNDRIEQHGPNGASADPGHAVDSVQGYGSFTFSPMRPGTSSWVSFSVVWDGYGRSVPYAITLSATLDGVGYGFTEVGTTLPPVARIR